jgi:hypothetical protein
MNAACRAMCGNMTVRAGLAGIAVSWATGMMGEVTAADGNREPRKSKEPAVSATYEVSEKMAVRVGPPVVVALSAPGETRWGFHQFPALGRLPNGDLLCTFNEQADAVAAYGGKTGAYVSPDGGTTWRPADGRAPALNAPHPAVSELFDGEYLAVPATAPFNAAQAKIALPAPAGSYADYVKNHLYWLADFPEPVRKRFAELPALRWTPRTRRWTPTSVTYDVRGLLLWARAGGAERFLLPRTWFERRVLRVGAELMYAEYRATYLLDGETLPVRAPVALMVSNDNGRSFQRRSTIAHDPTGGAGMYEPRLALGSGGELVCVIRRTDREQKPMALTVSTDAGRTWTPPQNLFEFGVWPSLTTLDSGVMALSFGRPGVWLSLSLDGRGRDWTAPIAIRPGDPENLLTGTCGYSDLLALDATSFLLVYSEFEHRDAQGRPCKAILARTIETTERSQP